MAVCRKIYACYFLQNNRLIVIGKNIYIHCDTLDFYPVYKVVHIVGKPCLNKHSFLKI